MTKSIKLIVTVSLILFIIPVAVAQQHNGNCSSHNTNRSIELDDSSSNEVVKVEVKNNTKHLMIGVNSTITSGTLTMEIFDPKGNKQGNFSVESMMNSNSSSQGKNKETVCGQLNKSFQDPMEGDWTVKLKPKKVSGKFPLTRTNYSNIDLNTILANPMNYRSIIVYNFIFCAYLLLLGGLDGLAQSNENNVNTVQGKLQLDSIWAPVVYLSHISSFNELYTMSNEMIIAEASMDSLGNFSFASDYLPEEDQLFRIHISKKGAPEASLIIGGDEENHLFIIANKSARVVLDNQNAYGSIRTVSIGGYAPNKSLQKINQIASYADSTHFNGSNMKREFVTKTIQEKLRFVADTAAHPLVSLYALHKSNFESNVAVNPLYYEHYLEKWQDERSVYFNSFRTQLPFKKTQDTFYYVLIGLAFFVFGFFLNRFLKYRSKQNKSQLASLSVQERKIFNLLKMGHSNKEISEEYSIGLSTVKSHVSSIYTKLNVKSRKEAMDFK